jgi:signal peptidase II
MSYGASINIIDNFFQITFIENPGMAFGLEFGGKLTLSIFTIFATLMIIYLIYRNRKESLYMRFSLAFILGGAVGNLVDRIFYGVIYDYSPIFYGKVVDFFHVIIPDFKLFGKTFYSWPILFGYKSIFHKKSDEVETPSITSENQTEVNNSNTENLYGIQKETDQHYIN